MDKKQNRKSMRMRNIKSHTNKDGQQNIKSQIGSYKARDRYIRRI